MTTEIKTAEEIYNEFKLGSQPHIKSATIYAIELYGNQFKNQGTGIKWVKAEENPTVSKPYAVKQELVYGYKYSQAYWLATGKWDKEGVIEWLNERDESKGEETEWISVTDRLPGIMSDKHDYSQMVLVLLNNYDDGLKEGIGNEWCEIDRYDWKGKYWDVFHFNMPKITHWQILPKPPKTSI